MFEGIYTVYRYTPRLPRRYVPGWTNSFRAFAGWGLWLFVSVFVCLCVPIVTIVLRDRQREDDNETVSWTMINMQVSPKKQSQSGTFYNN